MNSLEQKKIRAIAKILPTSLYGSLEMIEISGEDLILAGTNKVEEKEVDPKKVYYMKSPIYREANHYRRMKRSFIKRGSKGIVKYIKAFMKTPEQAEVIIKVLLP
jgi:hypothetical protein